MMIKTYQKEIQQILNSDTAPPITTIAERSGLSYNTIKAAKSGAGLTVDSLTKISDALLSIPSVGTCQGCAYDYGEDQGGNICAMRGSLTDGDGCGHWVKTRSPL